MPGRGFFRLKRGPPPHASFQLYGNITVLKNLKTTDLPIPFDLTPQLPARSGCSPQNRVRDGFASLLRLG